MLPVGVSSNARVWHDDHLADLIQNLRRHEYRWYLARPEGVDSKTVGRVRGCSLQMGITRQ